MTRAKLLNDEEFDWDFYEYALRVEKEWRKSLPRYSDQEWLKIFPEFVDDIPAKLKELYAERKELLTIIREKLKKFGDQDEITRWFCIEVIKQIAEGQELMEVSKQIERFKRLLSTANDINRQRFSKQVSEAELDCARNVPIEKVLVDVRLRKSGRTLIGLCPLHQEKTPSFTVYTDQNRFHCFGCLQNGDVINLVMRLKNFLFREAVEYLINI